MDLEVEFLVGKIIIEVFKVVLQFELLEFICFFGNERDENKEEVFIVVISGKKLVDKMFLFLDVLEKKIVDEVVKISFLFELVEVVSFGVEKIDLNIKEVFNFVVSGIGVFEDKNIFFVENNIEYIGKDFGDVEKFF